MAFLNIENKEDSPEKLAAIVGKPHNQFLFAGELNETVEKINELATMVPSQIITTGTVTFDEIERKATVSGFGYRLAGIVYTPVNLVSGYIPEEDEGFIKVYHVLGNSLGYLIIAGDSSETQIDPAPVPGTIYLTRFVVTGSVIGEPEAPILGSEFVKKAYSNRLNLFPPLDGIYELPSDGRTSFNFVAGGFAVKGFSIPSGHEHLYEGKLFYFKNSSDDPITFEHAEAATVNYNLPEGENFVFEPANDKVLMFKFSFEEGLTLLNVVTAEGFDPADYSLDQFVNPVSNPFLRTEDINIHYRGKYTSLANLEAAIPVGNDGDYVIVDAGAGTDAIQYIWDAEEGWLSGGTAVAADTDALPEGVSNLYFTVARVLATVLTGISFATGGAIVSTDTVLIAFGKLQKQISDLIAGKQDTLVSGTNIRTVNGQSLLGSTDLTVGSSLVWHYAQIFSDTLTGVSDSTHIRTIEIPTAFLSSGSIHIQILADRGSVPSTIQSTIDVYLNSSDVDTGQTRVATRGSGTSTQSRNMGISREFIFNATNLVHSSANISSITGYETANNAVFTNQAFSLQSNNFMRIFFTNAETTLNTNLRGVIIKIYN